ncbi:MAG TPA: hypothetical protein VE912_05040, partial [Bacteroidales bacterium]|nr:hypothetical protein [Bacteroidales bacterium]
YWLALAHVPKIQTKKNNEIIVRLFKKGISIIDFFELEQSVWEIDYELNQTMDKKKISKNNWIEK